MEDQKEKQETSETADLMLSAEMVINMPDKHFTIASARNMNKPDYNDKSKMVKKLILTLILSDGTQIDAYCNKTMSNFIAIKKGIALKNWIGFKGELATSQRQIGKELKNCIYIK